MTAFVFLQSSDFEIRMWEGKKLFCLVQPKGFVLLYFFTPQCQHCTEFTPFFESVASTLKGNVKYAMANAKALLPTLRMSQDTTTPINEVPYVLLYHDGWPIRRYEGPLQIESVKSFLEMAMAPPTSQATAQKPITEKVIETKNPNRICYLSYADAYKNNTMTPTPK